MFGRFQACGPPVGSVELSTSPLSSTARQPLAEAQETPVICTAPPPAVLFQLEAPAAGFVEVRTLPASLPLTQSGAAMQETPARSPGAPGAGPIRQAAAPPL